MSNTKEIGKLGVDSGSLAICDPCYLRSKDNETQTKMKEFLDYLPEHGFTNRITEACEPLALAVKTQGDGLFPVIGHFDEQGRLAKIEVNFERK